MAEPAPFLTPEARRQRNYDETVTSILTAARAVMRENGAADLNLHEVARRVGMRAPSLYNYFPNRNAIYEALFVRGMRLYCDQLIALHAEHGVSWAGVERTLEHYLAFALENPELYQLLFERPVPGFVPSEDGIAEAQRLLDVTRQIVHEAITAGTLSGEESVDTYMNAFIAICHGITAQHMANEPNLPLGSGRFGSLIPTMVAILRTAWSPRPGT